MFAASLPDTFPAKGTKVSRGSEALFSAVLGEQDALVDRVRKEIQARLPVYGNLPLDKLDDEVGLVLRCARASGTALNEDRLRQLTVVGEARAEQGVPLTDVLRAWRIGTGVTVHQAREISRRFGMTDAEVLEFAESILAWSDAAAATVAEGHQKAEFSLAYAEQARRAEFARGILFGTIPATEIRLCAEEYGVDPVGEYVAIRARADGGVATQRLRQAWGFKSPPEGSQGFCALVDGDIAGFLSGPPPRDVDGVVGYGPPRPLNGLADSYRLATRALMTAQACRLSGAHDIASLGLHAAVATDVDVGDSLWKRYLQPLGTGGSAGELVATLRAYLAAGLHVERTATELCIHQNTVRYRLARIEELTGTSLRDPEALFGAWWAVERSAMRL